MADPRFSDIIAGGSAGAGPGGFQSYSPFVNSARDYLETGDLPDFVSMLNPSSPNDLEFALGSAEQLGFESGGTGQLDPFMKAAKEAWADQFENEDDKARFDDAFSSSFSFGQNQRLAREAEIMAGGGTPAIGPPRSERKATPTPTPTSAGGGYGEKGPQWQQQMTDLVAAGEIPYETAIAEGWNPPEGFPSPTPAP